MTSTAARNRLDYLDAARAFALLLGIVFHASLSFLPVFIGWAVQDVSTSPLVGYFTAISHSFRLEVFFLLAGFFGYTTLQRRGTAAFVRSRALRIVVPFVVGWFLLRPLLVSGWIMGSASLRGDYDFWAGLRAGFASLRSLPTGLFTGSHLWFLYYLAMITGVALLVRAGLRLAGTGAEALMRRADATVAALAGARWALPVLAAPTAVALWFMRYWSMDTPDQSLRPNGPVLAVYGGVFVLGWMFGRQPTLLDRFTRLTPTRWFAAIAGAVATTMLGDMQMNPGHPHYVAAHVGFVVSYALMMWSLVLLTIGLFRKFADRPNPVVRYVADASYWLYLMHLPVVVWLQVALAEVALPWPLKLSAITVVSIAVLLIAYDLLVRPTIIGQVLNGRRRPRALFRSGPRTQLART